MAEKRPSARGTRPSAGAERRWERSPSRLTVLVTAIVGSVLTLAVAGVIVIALTFSPADQAPTPGIRLAVDTDTAAVHAADSTAEGSAENAAAAYLALQPTAVWLTPEAYPIGSVGPRVRALLDEAHAQNATTTIVVYGLPERDCGSFSAGGLSPVEYPEWTAEIGDELRADGGGRAILILEPDSLALAPECGNEAARFSQLRAAADALASPGTYIYLDGGHSNWLPAQQMADLLRGAGVEGVRGFVTNVSNYNATDREIDYAHRLAGLLPGAHAVIDTSRNGRGSDGQWCNPPDRLVGERGGTVGDDVVDTNLWVKVPGESDGTCNGGPAAGTWWPESAVSLTREVR
ncbi:glycoside hydrolase family 6 protein [Microbacterium jepli]|uniref:glycoside hydrolase family 6 protein n=1 Tax=Microbacterium sp. 1P10UE TaxID=3132288 RepID=UPI0039A097DD